MVKFILSIIFSILLLFTQNWLVMTWNGYQSISYSVPTGILTMLVINFFLSYSILHSIESAIPNSFKSASQEEQI